MQPERRKDKLILVLCFAIIIPVIALAYAAFVFMHALAHERRNFISIPSTESQDISSSIILAAVAIPIILWLGFVAVKAWKEFDRNP